MNNQNHGRGVDGCGGPYRRSRKSLLRQATLVAALRSPQSATQSLETPGQLSNSRSLNIQLQAARNPTSDLRELEPERGADKFDRHPEQLFAEGGQLVGPAASRLAGLNRRPCANRGCGSRYASSSSSIARSTSCWRANRPSSTRFSRWQDSPCYPCDIVCWTLRVPFRHNRAKNAARKASGFRLSFNNRRQRNEQAPVAERPDPTSVRPDSLAQGRCA
jgi:hypothetical protein